MLKLLGACSGLWLLGGCASAPIQQMSDARQSVQAAHAAGAEIRAPGLLQRAESDLSDAELSLTQHAYGQAKQAAVKARHEAVTARRLAVAVGRAESASQRADMLGLLDEATTDSLNRIEARAASVDHPGELLHGVQTIIDRLNERINRFYLRKAGPMIEQARNRRAAMSKVQRRRLDEVEQAYRNHHGKTAYDGAAVLLRALEAPGKGPRPKTTPDPQSRPSPGPGADDGRAETRRRSSA